jgi:general secretion pathway protein D
MLANALGLALSGCASVGSQGPTEDGPTLVTLPHLYETRISPGSKGKSKDDERFKLYPGNGVTVKAPVQLPMATEAAGNITLNFEGADLREVVRTILGDILKENYIVDPKVGGSITLRTTRPIPKAAAMHTLEEVLRMNGAVMIREGDGVFRIVPAATAGKGNTTPQLADIGKPLPGGFSIQVVPLKHIGVADMAKILEPLAGDPSSVRVDPLRNLLILSGTQLQLRHMIETVGMFDVDWISGMSVGLFTLQSVDVKTVTGELEKLFGDKNLGPLAGAVRVVPIERLNALLVVTPQAKFLEQARTWVERLDRPGSGGGGQRLYVYPVQNGKAENLASLLNDAFSKKGTQTKTAPAPTLAPGATPTEIKSAKPVTAPDKEETQPFASLKMAFGSADSVGVPQDVRIIADKDNNALLILASPADYESIESALRKLDVAVRQVLVEVTIAEVTLTDELTYGLEWYFNKGNGKGLLDTGASGLTSLIPGFSYSWLSLNYGAVLNALAKDSRLKIVSSPHITVADNQKAKIQVGDQVPTLSQTQSVEGSAVGIINSVQYTETGVLLTVTPRVNAGGQVTMEISQEVSNATQTETSNIDSPTIQKRTASSTVTVKSGETIILAGLIKEQKDNGNQGLPLLSKIPLIGGLFGTQTWKDNRTELIILITPHVLISTPDAAAITAEYRKRLTGLESMLKSVELPPRSNARNTP